MKFSTYLQQKRPITLFCGILLVALCLRAPITGVGPLLQSIQSDLHLNNAQAGVLVTLPLLAFAVFSACAPRLAARFGSERTIFAALPVLLFGIVWRSSGSLTALYGGTVLLSFAIAVGNVLLPGLVKQHYALKIGLVTALYALTLNLGAAAGSAFSDPLAQTGTLGWRGALALSAAFPALAFVVWSVQWNAPKPAQSSAAAVPQTAALWRQPLAWWVTFFMGLQSLMFYTFANWLPHIVADDGISPSHAGAMLGVMQLVVMPVTLAVPILAGRLKHQKWLGVACGVSIVAAILPFACRATAWYFPAVLLLGVGLGGAFSLCMMLFGLRSNNATEAARLSGMAQTIGYLLAAAGPAFFGVLHDWQHSWLLPLGCLMVLGTAIGICGYHAGKDRRLSDMQ